MKRKILFIIDSIKFGGGGAEKYISSLSLICRRNYFINILTLYDFKKKYPFSGKYFSLQENLKNQNILLKFLKFNTIIRPLKIYKYIDLISPDIIVSNTDYVNLFAIMAKKIFNIKIPLIIFTHTNPILAYKKKNKYLIFLMKIFYKFKVINKIIAPSNGIKSILEKYFKVNKNKIIKIPNGINIDEIKIMKKDSITKYREIFYSNKFIKFINIGRLHEAKGHKNLINAFYKVKKVIQNSKLIIIGEGELKPKLYKLINDLDLGNDIILIGFQQNPYKYLNKSDIFVLSSLRESFGLVVIEALACEIPVISTSCIGPREILENGKFGLIVKINDIDDMVEKMVLLARNHKLRGLLKRNSLIRAEQYNINLIYKNWQSLFNSILFE
ncbi:MAG: glycosyltransferase [Candidatus Helarchaeota archaeon]